MNEKIERLKGKGVVLTIQRLAVLEFLEASTTHPTVEEIYKALKEKYPSISQATVYSTLELLKGAGEIQELSIRKERACFDPNSRMHHHFFCRRCERILDVSIECPVSKRGEVDGHKVEEVQAYLYGVCADCLKK
ncbi:transcriptional repressor [bacterium]|nr:transcriptional repressor [bacterium]